MYVQFTSCIYWGEHKISVHPKKTNQRTKTIGRTPDTLAKVIDGLTSEWKALQMIDKTDRKDRVAPEGTWVHGGGIEIPCIYFLYWAKVHESNV